MAVPDEWWAGHGGYAARVLSALVADPDRVALHWRGRGVTAREVTDAVAGIADTLRRLDIGQGDVVGVMVAPNSPDMLTARYAAHLVGAAVCYVRSTNPGSADPVLSEEEQLRILLDTRARGLFTDTGNEDRAKRLVDRARGLVALVGFDLDPAGATAVASADRANLAPAAAWDPAALAVIGFTSGSTGRAKGISLQARAWESTVVATEESITEPDPAILVTTPLSHTVAPMADAVLARGGVVVLHEETRPGPVLDALRQHRITRTFVATPHLYELLDHSRTAPADLSSLRLLIYSGSPAAPARIAEAARAFGPVLVQGYGTSECGRITFLGPGDHFDETVLSSVGHPFPEIEVEVREPGSDRAVAVGETGEVCVRSPHVMREYWADPARTSRVLRDGWYRTGDIGRLDERGYLYLLDRIADVVKADGVKVYPAVVEREIQSIPGVAHAAVYGVRDEDNAEHVHAAIVLRPGARVGVDEVRERVRTALSAAHAPEHVRLLDALPLNGSGKPDKARLRGEELAARVPR
ncbi:AMP-binding protein [Actinosynnema sp. NPDC047251]|uniref:Putative fatty acid CoA ligase n=1 Tax=Saccharothrix espanaensis (strain ATCC 51144 / DSM 44229 / JCM 9112 / NBRC 15066 / NRRL 15764) TaxID=1179773 RepID=K0JQ71_SACES|nr:AMP-binding protein [Saccharothrix espanaensis]CCH29450.1 putative fatty acid CoA ligase [Saccharothrix espanaensis DSM 44229]